MGVFVGRSAMTLDDKPYGAVAGHDGGRAAVTKTADGRWRRKAGDFERTVRHKAFFSSNRNIY
jgi:hypothetical protein